jgi:hypothetical protein
MRQPKLLSVRLAHPCAGKRAPKFRCWLAWTHWVQRFEDPKTKVRLAARRTVDGPEPQVVGGLVFVESKSAAGRKVLRVLHVPGQSWRHRRSTTRIPCAGASSGRVRSAGIFLPISVRDAGARPGGQSLLTVHLHKQPYLIHLRRFSGKENTSKSLAKCLCRLGKAAFRHLDHQDSMPYSRILVEKSGSLWVCE